MYEEPSNLPLRPETEEPHMEQLESVSCGQTLQDEDNSRREEKLSPAQIRVKEITHFSFLRSRRPSQLHIHRKALWGPKGKGYHPIVGNVNLPTVLFARGHRG